MAETKYKQTEIGLIPVEWECMSIGDVGNTYAGLTGKSKQDFVKGNALYITFLNVLNNPILKPELFESVYVGVNERQNKAQRGDLFFNTSSETPEEVGICAMLDGDFRNLYLNSFCFGYRLKDNSIIPLFLSYYFRSDMGRRMMTAAAQGVTRYNLSKSTFNKIKIPLPPLAEQHAIASALTSVDNLIASLDKLIAKTQSVKQGAMQQLLMGLNYEDVKCECFHDVCLFVRGVTYNKEQEISVKGDGYNILRANNITLGTNTLNFEDVKVVCRDVRIKEEQFLHKNDILMCAGSGSKEHVGKVAYIDKDIDYAFGGFMAVIRTKTNLYSKFLFYILSSNSFKDYLDQAISCCTINNINSSMMRDFLIPIPSIETQHRIASALTAIDDQISALEAKRKKYEMVKVGMLHQLLTGRIRLT